MAAGLTSTPGSESGRVATPLLAAGSDAFRRIPELDGFYRVHSWIAPIAPGRVRAMSPRIQQMLGYSIHPPFMGHADGVHPLRYVERSS